MAQARGLVTHLQEGKQKIWGGVINIIFMLIFEYFYIVYLNILYLL